MSQAQESKPTLLRPPTHIPVSAAAVPDHPTISLYECWRDGARTLSDRPCGPGFVRRDVTIDRLSTYAPPPIDQQRVETSAENPQSISHARDESEPGNTDRCTLLEQEMARLDEAGRRKHSSFESDRLRERWHQLRDEAHAVGCPGR